MTSSRLVSSQLPAVVLLAAAGLAFDGSLEISAGPVISTLSPSDGEYEDRFLTPGTAYGGSVFLDAPGILGFDLTAQRFQKDGPSGWDGSIRATILSVWPLASLEALSGVDVYVGPGAMYVFGDYEGTDDFGRFVEAEGSSAGFGLTAGAVVELWGPISGRMDYRRAFMDIESDRATVDGATRVLYPPEETDLGYSQLGFSILVSITGAEASLIDL